MRQPDPSPREDAERPASLRPGDVIDGKYRLENILGSGGMGLVRAATHLQLGARVAIKLLRPSSSLDPAERDLTTARFIREAQLAVRIKSEHVARILDMGTLPGGEPYIAMELLEGVDLNRLVRDRGALPPGEAVAYVLQACEAIAEAHALGIVHRDLKPANLFLARRADGSVRVKVLDFGISKLVLGAFRDGDSTLTAKTDVLGSPQYMAPEQIRNPVDVDARSDIWSLGAVLYRLLTARGAFEGESAAAVLLEVISAEPVPVRELAPDVPPELAALVLRCLEKDRADRPADVDELARGLVPFATPLARARSWEGAPAGSSTIDTPIPSLESPSGIDAVEPPIGAVAEKFSTAAPTVGPAGRASVGARRRLTAVALAVSAIALLVAIARGRLAPAVPDEARAPGRASSLVAATLDEAPPLVRVEPTDTASATPRAVAAASAPAPPSAPEPRPSATARARTRRGKPIDLLEDRK